MPESKTAVRTTKATTTTTVNSITSSTPKLTATAKKLSKSSYVSLPEISCEESELEMYEEFEGEGNEEDRIGRLAVSSSREC